MRAWRKGIDVVEIELFVFNQMLGKLPRRAAEERFHQGSDRLPLRTFASQFRPEDVRLALLAIRDIPLLPP